MAAGEQRLDKWLFFARICKSRSLAQKLVLSGAVRVNREKIANTARLVRPGDVLTIAMPREVRVLEIRGPGERRGPARQAQELYADLGRPPLGDPQGEAGEAVSD